MWIGEAYYHLIPARAHLDAHAEAAFGNAVRLSPSFAPALFHLTELAVLSGDKARANQLLDRFRRASPDSDWVFLAEMTVGCATNGAASIDWLRAVKRATGRVVSSAHILASGGRYPDCAKRALSAVLAQDTAQTGVEFIERWSALKGLDYLLVSEKNNRGAVSALNAAFQAGVMAAPSLHVINASAGVHESDVPADSAIASLTTTPISAMLIARLRYLSLWYWHKSDAVRLDSVERRSRFLGDSTGQADARVVSSGAAARLALLRSDTTTALRILRDLHPAAEPGPSVWDLFEGLAAERLLLSQLQLATGDARGAIDTAELFDSPHAQIHLLYLPASLLVRAAAAAQLGEQAATSVYRSRLRQLESAPRS